jgi:hypothetical protein
MRRHIIISSVFLSIASSFAGKELIIAPAFQDKTLWCWAASCEMVCDAYGETEDQYDCAGYAVGGRNEIALYRGLGN